VNWLLAQDPINGPVSAEVFNWFAVAAGTIILALVGAIGVLYRAAHKDKAERLEEVKTLLGEQKDILKGALDMTNKVGNSLDAHTRQLEKVKEALELNTRVLKQVQSYLEEE
jgi:hypothetical protein